MHHGLNTYDFAQVSADSNHVKEIEREKTTLITCKLCCTGLVNCYAFYASFLFSLVLQCCRHCHDKWLKWFYVYVVCRAHSLLDHIVRSIHFESGPFDSSTPSGVHYQAIQMRYCISFTHANKFHSYEFHIYIYFYFSFLLLVFRALFNCWSVFCCCTVLDDIVFIIPRFAFGIFFKSLTEHILFFPPVGMEWKRSKNKSNSNDRKNGLNDSCVWLLLFFFRSFCKWISSGIAVGGARAWNTFGGPIWHVFDYYSSIFL